MKRIFLALLLVVCMNVTPALADTTPTSVVKEFYAQLVTTMKQGPQMGFAGRFKQMSAAVDAAYNIPLMTRFASGSGWASASSDEQQRLIKAFAAFSAANYASRFTKFDGEKFDVISEKPANGGGVIVETTLTPADSDPVRLNYLVRMDETGKPRIADVLLDATISELATRRAEFSAIVKRDGISALIATLEEKTKKMQTP